MDGINRIYILNTKTLENPQVFDLWYGRMLPERRQKIDRLRFDKDKRLSLGAGILMHEGLSRAGVSDIHLAYGEHEKPYLEGRNNVHFNLSHAGEIVICAVSDRPVGADVEAVRHFKEKLISYIYQPDEISYVKRTAAPGEADILYTELWTVKESIMKYLGTGITLGPDKVCVDMNEPVSAVCEGYSTENMHFARYALDGYRITVCSEYERFAEEPEWIEPL